MCQSSAARDFVLAYRMLSKSDDPRWSYDAMSNFQDGGNLGMNLPPASVLVKSHMWEGLSLFTDQISMWYRTPWLRYYYFRVSKYKRPPYWNSTSGLQSSQTASVRMISSIIPPSFVNIYPSGSSKLLAFNQKSNMATVAILDLCYTAARPPTRHNRYGLIKPRKFYVDRLTSFYRAAWNADAV